MALQSNEDLRLLNGLLPVSSGFLLIFPVFNLHLLISVGTQFHHLFFGRPLSPLTWWFLLNTWITFILLSILLTRSIQSSRHIPKYESIPKSPNSCINSLLYHFLQFLIKVLVICHIYCCRCMYQLWSLQRSCQRLINGRIINVSERYTRKQA